MHNNVQLPLALMPVPDRGYLPNRSWQLENVYNPDVNIETITWVAMSMTFYHRCRAPEEFLTAVETTLESPNRCVIVDASGRAPLHAFWNQVRGCFRDAADVFNTGRRQAHLLRQLVTGEYIILGPAVLGADQKSMYAPPPENAHRGLQLTSILGL